MDGLAIAASLSEIRAAIDGGFVDSIHQPIKHLALEQQGLPGFHHRDIGIQPQFVKMGADQFEAKTVQRADPRRLQ